MMKNLLGLTLIAALLVFFFDIAVSQAQSLPDEIDYVTYHKKYLSLKIDSDKKLQLLNAAEDSLADNQSHISELMTFRDQLVVEQAQTQQNLQNNRSQQNQLSSSISQINAQIQSLRQSAQGLNQSIASL